MKALDIGSLIKTLVGGMDGCSALRGIYPLVAISANTPLPYLTYRRTGLEIGGDKDEAYRDGVITVELDVYASAYTQSLEIANAIVDGMPPGYVDTDGFKIASVRLSNAVEDFQDNVFAQFLTFNIEIDF